MLTRSSLAVPTINFLLLLYCLTSCHARTTSSSSCVPSSCGKIPSISFPFRLKGDPKNCGEVKYELECHNNQLILNWNSVKYQVPSIDYEHFTIRLLDPSVERNNPCSFPLNYTQNTDLSYFDSIYSEYSPFSDMNIPLAFINCLNPVNSSTYIDISFCTGNGSSNTSLISSGMHNYVAAVDGLPLSDLEVSCRVEKVVPVVRLASTNYTSLSSIHEAVATGFELSWYYPLCSGCRGDCSIEDNSLICHPSHICYEDTPYSERSFRCRLEYWAPFIVFFGVFPVVGILGFRLLCGLPCLIALIVYQWKRRHLWSEHEKVQDLIKGQNHFKPIQYSYSEIKKMTKNFKEKLGGAGSSGYIYRAKLRSGPTVAVKTMDKATANPEEFLRFVAAAGTVDHVNVMQLIGFCFEGQKQALVYDLMPNGSIQKYISPREEGDSDSVSLSCEILYGISLGVARGIDYLHRNCDIQAPHLCFRPHNVLLDENLVPKISDFGLTKLFRGLAYVAPEFYYNNVGEVADHKADVYSFGKLLVGMIRTVKNVNSYASPESQKNSSSWIYDQLVEEGSEGWVEIGEASAEERKKMKKMIRVASLCTQMTPTDRPSMGEVVKILEEDDEEDDAEIRV